MAVIAGLVTTALVIGLGFLTRRYGADSAFIPNSSAISSGTLVGLAAQFGIGAGALGAADQSVDFYADLVQSRELLTAVVQTQYAFPVEPSGTDSLSGDLVTLYDVSGSTPLKRLQKAVKRLNQDVSVSVDEQGGVVSVRVRQKWPVLAEQVNQRLLDLVNDFNVRRRESQAGMERRFVEGRVQDAQNELKEAEDNLRGFLETNRTYQSSPRLTFEEGRLQRQIDLRQQLYTTLSQSYEQARMDEVRNTPVVTVVDHPGGSARPTRTTGLILIAAMVLGLVGGPAATLVAEFWQNQRQENMGDYEELVALKATLFRRLRHPDR